MAKAFEVVYLHPEDVIFERRGDTLSLTLNDETDDQGSVDQGSVFYPRVVLRSCFPVSETSLFLSVRDANEDKEVGIIEDWTKLSAASREAVAMELNLHYFVPKIEKVHEIKEELGFLYWTVDTDKGPQEFVMRNSVIRYTREVSPGHWLIIDVNQARHEIPDMTALDAQSQKLLRRFLYL